MYKEVRTVPSGPEEINWEKLNKTKFFIYGIGLFNGVSILLYPLSVIKTRQVAFSNLSPGIQGVNKAILELWKNDGLRSFYKGYGTVCLGTIPARILYLSTLELTKDTLYSNQLLHELKIPNEAMIGTANFFAGGLASLSSQLVFVPIDVISQRLMVLNKEKGKIRMNGLKMAKLIINQEGVRGLWKGFFTSIGTLAPNSAIWWASYGSYKNLFWKKIQILNNKDDAFEEENISNILSVQVCSGIMAGLTTSCFTTPLDVIKTRLQLTITKNKKERIGFFLIAKKIYVTEGLKGFVRGMLPRSLNSALWGTTMVNTYEFLKRICM